jgi:hypothetical protein
MNEVDIQCMSEAQRLDFINEGADSHIFSNKVFRSAAFAVMDKPIDTDELNAAIMGAGIVGFLEGMSRRNKRIVKRTFAFAQLKSIIAYPDKAMKQERFQYFRNVMTALGWGSLYGGSLYHHTSATSLKLANILMDVLGVALSSAVGGTAGALKQVATHTVESLKKEPEAIKLFNRNVKELGGESFGMASCKQDEDAEVSMVLGMLDYSSSEKNTDVLFGEWHTSSFNLLKGYALLSIHEEDYKAKYEAAVEVFLEKIQDQLFMEYAS